jgi:hypothetical protein
MDYNPKFQDGEKVLLDGEVVTIRRWSYATNLKRYTYSIVEYPGTFFYENELQKLEDQILDFQL